MIHRVFVSVENPLDGALARLRLEPVRMTAHQLSAFLLAGGKQIRLFGLGALLGVLGVKIEAGNQLAAAKRMKRGLGRDRLRIAPGPRPYLSSRL